MITPFGTLPSGVNWVQVPGDLIAQLAAGTETAIGQGLVSSTPVANPLATLANLLGLNLPGAANDPSPLGGLADLSGLTDNAVTAAAGATLQSQNPVPSTAKVSADSATDTKVATEVPTKSDNPIKAATARTETAAKSARAHTDASVKKAADRLDKIAKDGQKQIQKVVKDVQDDMKKTVKKTVKTVAGADGSAHKTSEKSAS